MLCDFFCSRPSIRFYNDVGADHPSSVVDSDFRHGDDVIDDAVGTRAQHPTPHGADTGDSTHKHAKCEGDECAANGRERGQRDLLWVVVPSPSAHVAGAAPKFQPRAVGTLPAGFMVGAAALITAVSVTMAVSVARLT